MLEAAHYQRDSLHRCPFILEKAPCFPTIEFQQFIVTLLTTITVPPVGSRLYNLGTRPINVVDAIATRSYRWMIRRF
jgi:hypothetical protein